MRRKLSESVRAKTFLSLLALLGCCCALIYATVLVCLPKSYRAQLEGQAAQGLSSLIETLERDGWEASSQSLLAFSMGHNASVTIRDQAGRRLFSVNFADSTQAAPAPAMSCSASFRQGGETLQLSAEVSLAAASQSYDVLVQLIPFVAAVVLLVSTLGALVCSRHYANPLVAICGVARRMAALDMTWQCPVDRRDEIGVLAASLNQMSQRLREAMEGLRAANSRLQQDILREREQERQRVDFFTAVSHELKTPLAVLKGELEGMIYQVGEYRDRDAYLRRCAATADRMEALLGEILAAARLGGEFRLARAPLDLSALLRRACRELQGRAEDKGQRLLVELPAAFPYEGDARLLEKALSNVLGNAVDYSPPGATIRVALAEGELSVENSGAHIAPQDLPRLFTPFYRVEKSRSRNSGGSGLGLSITKAVLDRHGVPHRLENTPGGVLFSAMFRWHFPGSCSIISPENH